MISFGVSDPTERRLIINADDFGLTPGVNRGIMAAWGAGTVTSTSLLANLPAFEDAVTRARSAPGLGVGLHFNLTAGRPVSDPGSVPGLCASHGSFHALPSLAARALAGRIAEDELARECRAQLERLRSAGIEPTHIDSHRHVHCLPHVRQAAERTARDAGIRVVRVPFEPMRISGQRLSSAAEQAALRLARFRSGAGADGDKAPRFRGSVLFNDPDFQQHLLDLLDRLEPGTTELMVHPGFNDAEIAQWDSYTWQRERELLALISTATKERLARGDITLASFGGGRPTRAPLVRTPRFSVVVPAYNESALLPGLLESLETARRCYSAQRDAIEIIVVDNDSSDDTAELARRAGACVIHETTRVIGVVRNAGAAAARGEILAFVDADSRVHPRVFQAIDRALRGSVVGGATGVTMDRWSPSIAVVYGALRFYNRWSGWDTGMVFCRRADFEAIGGFDPKLRFAEDLALYQRLKSVGEQRGESFVRLKGVRTVTSTRKFRDFGGLRWLIGNARVVVMDRLGAPGTRDLVDRYWYRVRS